MIKKLNSLSIFLTLQILFTGFFICFAAGGNEDAPPLTDIVSIMGRILNIAIGIAGIVLVIMIAYGIWKSSLATGDPRGLEGAKQTWTHALYGFFIVIGAFTLVVIISGILGISLLPSAFLKNFSDALTALLNPK